MMVAKAVRGQEGMVATVMAKAGWSLWLWWWCDIARMIGGPWPCYSCSQHKMRWRLWCDLHLNGMVTMGVAWPMPR